MKLYILIKKLLVNNPEYRDSDKKLMWKVWEIELDYSTLGHISFSEFMKVSTPESITRARRMVQQDFKELAPSENVRKRRKHIQDQKGTHVYREDMIEFDNETGTAYIK